MNGWICIANGSFILLSSPLVAGTVFMVQQNTLGSGANFDRLLGRAIAGGVMGEEGRMVRLSIKLTGWRLGSV